MSKTSSFYEDESAKFALISFGIVQKETECMFTTARYFIKTSFAFFVLGIVSGLYIYGAKIFGWSLPFTLIQAHYHVLLMGGMLMMILGVAIWFFPRAKKDDKNYNPDVVRASYWIYTSATISRFVAEIFQGYYVRGLADMIGFWSSAVQVLAVVTIIFSIWGRIRPVGSHIREQKGEKF
jgi:heme/copper-type cytochrome/quinol oxidase subunit 1